MNYGVNMCFCASVLLCLCASVLLCFCAFILHILLFFYSFVLLFFCLKKQPFGSCLIGNETNFASSVSFFIVHFILKHFLCSIKTYSGKLF